MAWTQEQITALEEAIATGATSVKYQDRQINYGSLTEMRELLVTMRRQLNASTRPKWARGRYQPSQP